MHAIKKYIWYFCTLYVMTFASKSRFNPWLPWIKEDIYEITWRGAADVKHRSGTIDLIPENSDDIYTLYNLIDSGDHIKSKTSRKVVIGNSLGNNSKSSKNVTKIYVVMEIKVETMYVDLEASMLFVKGLILSDDIENVKSGSYHTIDIFPGHRFKIYKKEWSELTLSILRKVQKNDSSEMLFIIIQQNAFLFCDVTQNFSNIKKRIDYKGKNFKQAMACISSIGIEKYNIVVVASNFEIRNEFKKALLTDKLTKNFIEKKLVVIKLETDGSDVLKTINNLLMDPSSSKTFMNIQFIEELKEMNLFLKNFELAQLVCIGFKEVDEAFEFGAVKTLLITNEMFKSYDINSRKKVEELCKGAKGIGAKICILPVKHWLGEKLQAMGGISANLKYEYK